ncbi:MAG TPA: ATP-binding protein [Thermoplasmatales archaeon]|nr:ATP-binding protein [Thermoplasmatales archaeon]
MERKTFDNSKINKNLENIKHKIIVLSGKGGVGKSTVSANLALSLAEKGYSVGLLDSDFHGPSIPKILGIEKQHLLSNQKGVIDPVSAAENLKVISIGFLLEDQDTPVIWRGPLKMNVMRQFIGDVNWGKLDYLIIDLPPGTGDEPLSVTQLIPNVDGAIVVTTPQDVALISVRKSINFVKKMNIPLLGIIENMSGFRCPHCGKHINIFKTGGGEKAAKDFKIPFLGKVPIDPEIVESGDSGTPIFLKNPEADSSKAFAEIVSNIEKNIKNKEVK